MGAEKNLTGYTRVLRAETTSKRWIICAAMNR